jgi:hypothetical protein
MYKSGPGVVIVPTGLDYSHYWKFRQTQFINFGEPIHVNEYWEDYEENPSAATNKLRDRLAEEMKKYMIHIETEEYYDLYMAMRTFYNRKMCKRLNLKRGDLAQEFAADKKLISTFDKCLEKEPDKIQDLNTIFTEYKNLRNKLRIRDWVPRKKKYSIMGNAMGMLLSVLTLPLVLIGLFNNWPHFFLAPRMKKNIKDTQFYATAIWGAGFVMILLYYIVLSILVLILLQNIWVKLAYILTLSSSGLFALAFRNYWVKSWARIRYSVGQMRKNSAFRTLKTKYDQVTAICDEIVEKYLPQTSL